VSRRGCLHGHKDNNCLIVDLVTRSSVFLSIRDLGTRVSLSVKYLYIADSHRNLQYSRAVKDMTVQRKPVKQTQMKKVKFTSLLHQARGPSANHANYMKWSYLFQANCHSYLDAKDPNDPIRVEIIFSNMDSTWSLSRSGSTVCLARFASFGFEIFVVRKDRG